MGAQLRISILLNNALGIGGTVASALTLASALSRAHDVEVVSVFRRQDTPLLPVDPRVRFGSLLDMRDRATAHGAVRSGTSELVPGQEEYFRQYSRSSDDRLAAYAARSGVDVIIATRPSLAIALAKIGTRAPLVFQMHHVLDRIPTQVHEELVSACGQASAIVAVSSSQSQLWRNAIGPGGPLVHHIPNPVPASPLPSSDPSSHSAVAVGRLDSGKRFDRVMFAFDKVADRFADWSLDIVGDGPERPRLELLRSQLAHPARVRLVGRTAHVYEYYSRASVLISASEFESFGMTLIEGMRSGLATLSSDCDVGPRELIDGESNGLKFPVNETDVFIELLRTMLGSEGLRRRLSYGGSSYSRIFDPHIVAGKYEEVFRKM